MPPHILSVYQQPDPSMKFIAKKVRDDAAELKILKLINTFRLKSENIISLHESFQTQSTSWTILPKMISLAGGQLYWKAAQVCWGLIKGVAYLHKHCIAHWHQGHQARKPYC
jgi:serine/threonine protein kinase